MTSQIRNFTTSSHTISHTRWAPPKICRLMKSKGWATKLRQPTGQTQDNFNFGLSPSLKIINSHCKRAHDLKAFIDVLKGAHALKASIDIANGAHAIKASIHISKVTHALKRAYSSTRPILVNLPWFIKTILFGALLLAT